MSKHKHRDRLTPSDIAAGERYEKTLPDIRVVPPMTDAELVESQDAVLAAIQEDQGIRSIPTGAKAADPFLAEDMTFRTTHDLNVVTLLNSYLNEFRKAHPNAALLQMIPTGPASFTFVWEL